jgi:hypothetical protein
MFVIFLVRAFCLRACDVCFVCKCMVWRHFIASHCWVCCLYVLLKYCCLDGILFFVLWTGITKVSFEIKFVFIRKTKNIVTPCWCVKFQFWNWGRLYVPLLKLYVVCPYSLNCMLYGRNMYTEWVRTIFIFGLSSSFSDWVPSFLVLIFTLVFIL